MGPELSGPRMRNWEELTGGTSTVEWKYTCSSIYHLFDIYIAHTCMCVFKTLEREVFEILQSRFLLGRGTQRAGLDWLQ